MVDGGWELMEGKGMARMCVKSDDLVGPGMISAV